MEKDNQKDLIPSVTFDEFKAPTYEEWKETATKILRGAPFEKKLLTKTYEGITLQPIYTEKDTRDLTEPETIPGSPNYLRSANTAGYINGAWGIAQAADAYLPQDANEILKTELEKGTNNISFNLAQETLIGKDMPANKDNAENGVSLASLNDVETLLANVDLEKYPFNVFAGLSAAPLIGAIFAIANKNNLNLENLKGCIGADPIATLAAEGKATDIEKHYDEMAALIKWSEANMPNMKTILINGSVYSNGGGNAVQEVAYCISTAITYIDALQKRDLNIDTIAKHIRFSFSLGANFFMEIAKLRAARVVWAQVIQAFDGNKDSQKLDIFAHTAEFTQTLYDPYVNILRTTTQAFSGVVAGIDSMQVDPLDKSVRPSNTLSRRISRNIQLMLQSEFDLLQPIDPSGGSWYIEKATQEVADAVWTLIQQIDADGGMVKALEAGKIQNAIEDVLQMRFKNLATRKDRAVGTNMYANIDETRIEQPEGVENLLAKRQETVKNAIKEENIAKAEALNNTSDNLIADIANALNDKATFEQINNGLNKDARIIEVKAIEKHRWTEQYEAMRVATDNYKAQNNDNVKVFLANMGPIPQHKPRADFTRGFFEVAGFEVIGNDGFKTPEEAAIAAKDADADVVVICSTDADYPEVVPVLAKLLKDIKPKTPKVILAGAPAAEHKDNYVNAGVEEFIHVKANCYEILSTIQKEKGMI